jgi:hypothetical protein
VRTIAPFKLSLENALKTPFLEISLIWYDVQQVPIINFTIKSLNLLLFALIYSSEKNPN